MGLRISDAFADYRAMTEPQRFLIYQSEDGATRIDVMLAAEITTGLNSTAACC